MKLRLFIAQMLAVLASGIAGEVCADEATESPHYYTLAISLAPAFCQLHPELHEMRQCREGFAVIVHGLWPERIDGRKAENCSSDQPALSPVQERVLEKLMPDDPLRVHEWRKHGSCTGMSAQEYFRAIMAYANRLRLPEELNKEGRDQTLDRNDLVTQIIRLNTGLPAKGVYLRCQGQDAALLTEVRVCYKPNGQFTECINTFKPNCPTNVTIRAVP